MQRQNSLEEIRFWEHPPWSGTAHTQEKNKEIFKENQTGLLQPHFKTHRCIMVKLELISGPSQEISFTVITWNPESNKPTFLVCQHRNSVLQHRSFVLSHVFCTVASAHQWQLAFTVSVQFTLRVSLYTDMCKCNRLMILMRTSLEWLKTKSAQDTCSQTHMSHSLAMSGNFIYRYHLEHRVKLYM